MSMELLVFCDGLLGPRKSGTLFLVSLHDSIDFLFSYILHDIEESFSEAQGHLRAEVEVLFCADAAIGDIKTLGKDNAQQSVPNIIFNLFRDLHGGAGARDVPLFNGEEDRCRPIAFSLFHFSGIGLIHDRVSVAQVDHIKRSSEYKFLSHGIHLCCTSYVEKVGRLIDPVFKDSIQHKADHIVRDDRCLAGLGKKPEHVINGLLTRTFPIDDLHGQAAPGRRKEMCHRRPFRMFHVRKYSVRRDRTGVGCDDGILPDNPFHPLKYLFFQVEVFGCRLNYQIAVADFFVIGCIGDIL